MNIKEAKEEIKNTVKAYLVKDEYGSYLIPQNKQRPVFLMGPPGIGKTEIMSQIASELGIGMLSYSMTHHTRQSALGLPLIKQKTFFGKEFDVSEYTMSEIIAEVYELMENSGVMNGILFLDEVNCVSETLMPIMLQFLQYKVFGSHKVPEGWIIVTAGNPPEYNDSVKEFDIATWDRLKRIDVEPDFKVWKEYAYNAGVHAAIITYLEIKENNFYKIESTVDGKSFVTARGWDDMSRMIKAYEANKIPVGITLVSQYIQNKKIARDFSNYYELFQKYKSDYQINDILNGNANEKIISRATSAKFDERFSLIGLLLDAIRNNSENVISEETAITKITAMLKQVNKTYQKDKDIKKSFDIVYKNEENERSKKEKANNLSSEDKKLFSQIQKYLNEYLKVALKNNDDAFIVIKKHHKDNVDKFKKIINQCRNYIDNSIKFCEKAFGSESQEILIMITELTVNNATSIFISKYNCTEYYKHNKDLLFYERQTDILNEISNLDYEI